MSFIYRGIQPHRLQFPHARPFVDLSLYLVANRPSFSCLDSFIFKITEAVKGGVSCVQFRDHQSDFATTLKTAHHLKTKLKCTPLFINTLRSLEVARKVEATGVFLEKEISLCEARNFLGERAIIGLPIRTMHDVFATDQTNKVDYLSIKIAAFKKTCPQNDDLWGMEGLRRIRELTPHRLVAMGGLSLVSMPDLVPELRFSDGIAMASSIMEQPHPCLAAQKIQALYKKLRAQNE